MSFREESGQWVVGEVSNQSTGYCPDIGSWPAVAEALDRIGIRRPSGFTHEVVFRRCRSCRELSIVREEDFVCVFCGEDLPRGECRGARVTGQTARIASRCECGSVAVRQVSQFVLRDELWWDSEFSCGSCGIHLCEHAGPGPAPDDVRGLCSQRTGPSDCGWPVRFPVLSQL